MGRERGGSMIETKSVVGIGVSVGFERVKEEG